MRIRDAVLGDAAALAVIHVDTWRATYRGTIANSFLDRLEYGSSEQRWKSMLAKIAAGESGYGSGVLVVEDETRGVIGFASFGSNRDKDTEPDSELYAIYVSPSCQAKGAGRMLLDGVRRNLADSGFRSMVVWVLSANPARLFYEKMGGKEVKERKVQIGGEQYDETAYAWVDIQAPSLSTLLARRRTPDRAP